MGPPTPQTHRVLHDRHLGAGSTFRKRPAGRANGCGCTIGRGRRAAAPARARPRSIRSPRERWSRANRSRRPPAVPMISPGRADKSYVNRRRAKPPRHPFRPRPKPPRKHRRERRKKLVGTGPRDVEAAGSNIPSSDRHGGALDCVQENDNYPSRLCLARPCHHCYREGSSRPTALSPLILGGHLALRLQLRFVRSDKRANFGRHVQKF